MLAGLTIIGVVVCSGAVALLTLAFLQSVGWLTSLWLPPLTTTLVREQPSFSVTLAAVLALAAFVAGRLLEKLPETRPKGPADLLGTVREGGELEPRASLRSSALAWVSLSGGASVGIFGPVIFLGGFIASKFGDALTRRGADPQLPALFIGAGTAAAITALFTTPVGALIFAHEAILRRLSVRSVWMVGLASAIATAVTLAAVGTNPLFRLENAPALQIDHVLTAIAIGLLVALVAAAYIHLAARGPGWVARSGIEPRWRPFFPAAILFLLSPYLPQLLGTGLGAIEMALRGEFSVELLLWLVIAKVFATSLCLACGFFGGIFTPALFIGVMLGAALGLLMPTGHSMAVVGAAACIAVVTGTPLASTVIVYEMTGSFAWAGLSALAIGVATPLTYALAGRSLYDLQWLIAHPRKRI